MRYVLPDNQLSFCRVSLKLSTPKTRLCDPVPAVDRKYVSFANQSQLLRASSQPSPQTAQKVGALKRAWPRDRSQIGVPCARSVKRDPTSVVVIVLRDSWPSRKRCDVRMLVSLTAERV